ncbi:HpaII family restriction endonuclease [Neisseria animaloris]|uniref:HpaII family restriction endonuclease n=1 Tax=Neisseria animaloris TaxID=326522 RepID=UPI0039DF6D46
MPEVFSGNKGEWSEPYVLFKLLADGQLYLGDGKLNKIDGLIMPILAVLREEQHYIGKYSYSDDRVNVVISLGEREASYTIPVAEFKKQAVLLFQKIRSGNSENSGSFSIPEIEDFLRSIDCTRLNARSQSKSDIHIMVHDARTGICPTLGFSIKSEMGSKPTLLNASGATNFTFEIPNCNKSLMDLINSESSVKRRIAKIYETGRTLIFSGMDNSIFRNNLMLIDSWLPEIMAQMLCKYYSGSQNAVSCIADSICQANPNGYDQTNRHQFYIYKIKKLLNDAALGMRPAEVWQGKYDATGGYLVVRQDGEIVCYHIYSRNEFEDYLFYNTKFDTPSSSRHRFGNVYEYDGRYFVKLNMQIRFI